MTDLQFQADPYAFAMVWTATFLALLMAVVVLVERGLFAGSVLRKRRLEHLYGETAARALGGDDDAMRTLASTPRRHRWAIAETLVLPLINDRAPERIARTREIVYAMGLAPLATSLLESRWWWLRALALRATGLLQLADRTAAVIAALDDVHPEVRAAALDAIADLRDPASLQALVVRLHDESLQPGRVAAAVTAFGADCEPFLLAMGEIDEPNRISYARALSICGTSRARDTLCRWTADPNLEVRAAAFEALAHVGLDASAAEQAIRGLDSDDVHVRAMAAYALHDWTGPGEAASRLAQHLDDTWAVALRAAQSLRTLKQPGIIALQASASRPDLAGVLARQTLWEMSDKC